MIPGAKGSCSPAGALCCIAQVPRRRIGSFFGWLEAMCRLLGRVGGRWPEPCQIRLGTSAFTAAGWPGTFYPAGHESGKLPAHYATRFDTVEVDSTFYGTPKAQAVNNWKLRTPPGFIFSVKIPQTITHEKVLLDCDAEFQEFVETMKILGEKLGPMVFQFPFFGEDVFSSDVQFVSRLKAFLKKLPRGEYKFAVEIKNHG